MTVGPPQTILWPMAVGLGWAGSLEGVSDQAEGGGEVGDLGRFFFDLFARLVLQPEFGGFADSFDRAFEELFRFRGFGLEDGEFD